ncbi:MAG TPA: twin-arginine translocase TatA/TatE family subunit [Thermodesulfobacteriota bacterium]
MFGLGMPELLIILVIIVIIFGAGRLPEIGQGLGRAIRNFRESTAGRDAIEVNAKKEGDLAADKKDVKS